MHAWKRLNIDVAEDWKVHTARISHYSSPSTNPVSPQQKRELSKGV
jgi:hypothetical protein